tara:strand:- start:466 stop:834 length:369 start_codon:yes stop_codon:yes gene_type:complete
MSSLGVSLPLRLDMNDGFGMIKNFQHLCRQNIKMIILTNPGERVMEPDFGVGIRTLLFNNFTEMGLTDVDTRIREQTDMYLPAIAIEGIEFVNIQPDVNSLGIRITYSIPAIGTKDLLEFTI